MRPWLLVLVACNSSSGTPSASKQFVGDVPVGVWVGIDADTIYDPNHFHDEMRVRAFAFWPDGRFNKRLPSMGLADFDQAAYERELGTNPSIGGEPGTYKRDGDGWTLTYKWGHETKMKYVNDRLETEKARLYRAKDINGAVLDGTYTWYSDPEDPLLARPGCQPLVTFTKDGAFEDRGGFDVPCKTSGPTAPGSGTYELRDYSIVMHYKDGRTVKHVITPVVNGDLHKDNSRAIIAYQVWSRRTGAIAAAEPASAPTTPPPTVTNSNETVFDAVAFATPAGTVQRGGSTITFTDASGDQLQCMTVVFAGVASTGDPKRDFAADWKDVMLNGRTADASPSPDAAQTPSGLVFTVGGSMTTEASNGTRVYRALFVFEVGGNRVDVMLIAPTEAGLANCHVDDLVKSMKKSR
ncbi:MAG: hypothetical protein QM831_22815 [Kofleriaceae bacterium]